MREIIPVIDFKSQEAYSSGELQWSVINKNLRISLTCREWNHNT